MSGRKINTLRGMGAAIMAFCLLAGGIGVATQAQIIIFDDRFRCYLADELSLHLIQKLFLNNENSIRNANKSEYADSAVNTKNRRSLENGLAHWRLVALYLQGDRTGFAEFFEVRYPEIDLTASPLSEETLFKLGFSNLWFASEFLDDETIQIRRTAVSRLADLPSRQRPEFREQRADRAAFDAISHIVLSGPEFEIQISRLAAIEGNMDRLAESIGELTETAQWFEAELSELEAEAEAGSQLETALTRAAPVWRAQFGINQGTQNLYAGLLSGELDYFDRATSHLARAIDAVDAKCTPIIYAKALLLQGRVGMERAYIEAAQIVRTLPNEVREPGTVHQPTHNRLGKIFDKFRGAESLIRKGLSHMPLQARPIDWARGAYLFQRNFETMEAIIGEYRKHLGPRGVNTFGHILKSRMELDYLKSLAANIGIARDAVCAGNGMERLYGCNKFTWRE